MSFMVQKTASNLYVLMPFMVQKTASNLYVLEYLLWFKKTASNLYVLECLLWFKKQRRTYMSLNVFYGSKNSVELICP